MDKERFKDFLWASGIICCYGLLCYFSGVLVGVLLTWGF